MSTLCAPADRDAVDRIAGFALVLRAAGLMPPDEIEYFTAPWKWQPEYEAWEAAGQPDPDQAGTPLHQRTLASLRWDRFVDQVAQ